MARLISLVLILLAILGAASLVAMPLQAGKAVDELRSSRQPDLPHRQPPPEELNEPPVPVEEMREQLELPRVDDSPDDEHSEASIKAYREGDYETAFEEAVLALDPAPLEENDLYETLTTIVAEDLYETVEKPNGREAVEAVSRALQPILERQEPETAARLNNAAVMTLVYLYSGEASEFAGDQGGVGAAEELAFQAADADGSSCAALLNLTLFNSLARESYPDLEPAGLRVAGGDPWTEHYSPAGCGDPALAYYRIQTSVSPGSISNEYISAALKLADELERDPEWVGLAHSARGDVYYWHGLYSFERGFDPRSFTARRYFELALEEYDSALALQPDDTAIHNGKALAHLGLGETEKAVREAEKAFEDAPESPWIQRTVNEAYEAEKDYSAAARMNRESISEGGFAAMPPATALVPYSPISHGSDLYRDVRVTPLGAAAGAFLTDDDVIKPFEERSYFSTALEYATPGGSHLFREEVRHYDLLRQDLLLGDRAAFRKDLERAPEAVLRNEKTAMLLALDLLPENPEDAPTDEFRSAVDDYINAQVFEIPITEDRGFFYIEAGNFFRKYERYGEAIHVYELWRGRLEGTGADGERRSEAEGLIGEALFLDGRYEESLSAFDRALELRPSWPPYMVRRAFMLEKLGEYDRAQDAYQEALEAMDEPNEFSEGYDPPSAYYTRDNYQAAKHLGDMLFRKARNHEVAQDESTPRTRSLYLEAAAAYEKALGYGAVQKSTVSASNMGLSLVKAGEYRKAIEVLKLTVEESASGQPLGLDNPPTPDGSSPVFRLNLGWAYELNGQPKEAREQYLAALDSDPTFFPAMNDLGVLAAKQGEADEALGYFEAALGVEEGYDFALYNTGVALMRSGEFLAAQHYLGRAVDANPSLAGKSYDYAFDNELYYLNLSMESGVPPDWEFAARAERSAFVVSFGAVFLLFLGIVRRMAVQRGRDTVVGGAFERLKSFLEGTPLGFLARLRDGWLRFMRFGSRGFGGPFGTLAALAISVPAISLVQWWPLLWADSAAKGILLASLLYVTLVSLLVHHAGHALVALAGRASVREAPWPAGIAQAILLAALGGPAVAPMPATSVEGEAVKEQNRQLILLAGPLASLLFSVLFYVLFLASHMPLMRFGAALNLGLAGVSLLALPPLEGADILKGGHTRLVFGITTVITILTTLLAIEIL